MSIQELRTKANAAGFFIAPRANKIDNYQARKILESLGKPAAKPVDLNTGPKHVKLPAYVNVRDFAELLKLPVVEVIKDLIKNGILATINEEVDFETASIIASDFGFEVESESTTAQHFGLGFLQDVLAEEKPEQLKPRPPIVAVMGHVDHGKTTLLDAIRKTNVVGGESGGITQHIGAYQVKKDAKTITFLDTPGHEAFSEMRARGANVTDLIVLVVAADDGVRPQTIEVINRAKFTDTPMIVAINKIDKETASPMRVKQELAEHGVLTESFGGKVPVVEISAKKNIGLDELFEMILLVADLENFRANPAGKTVGTVIESHTETGKGAVATVIIQNGTLQVGDVVVAGAGYGKVKSLEDEYGKRMKAAAPSSPAQISGFSLAPEAGDILQKLESLETAKTIAESALRKNRSHKLLERGGIVGDKNSKTLNLIIKADVAGSLEAIKQSLAKLKNDEVKVNILNEGVGEINESDVLLAAPARATILAFRTKTNPKAINLAKQKKVAVDSYEVIYELIEDITTAVVALFTPEYERHTIGRGKVLAIFRTEKDQMIIGGKVEEGELRKDKLISVWRGEAELGRGEIADLQQSKVATKEVSRGTEFGMKLKTTVKIKEGDVLECFEETLKQKTL